MQEQSKNREIFFFNLLLCTVKKHLFTGVLQNICAVKEFAKLTEKQLCQSLFVIEL